MYRKKLYKREDARRLAATFLQIRKEHGEELPRISVRRMDRMNANLVASFAAIPQRFRTARIAKIGSNTVIFKLGGAGNQVTQLPLDKIHSVKIIEHLIDHCALYNREVEALKLAVRDLKLLIQEDEIEEET